MLPRQLHLRDIAMVVLPIAALTCANVF